MVANKPRRYDFGPLKPIVIRKTQATLTPIDPVKAQHRAMRERQKRRHEKNRKQVGKYPIKRRLTGLVLPIYNFDKAREGGSGCKGGSPPGDLQQGQG
jgi:hypothetical protein